MLNAFGIKWIKKHENIVKTQCASAYCKALQHRNKGLFNVTYQKIETTFLANALVFIIRKYFNIYYFNTWVEGRGESSAGKQTRSLCVKGDEMIWT